MEGRGRAAKREQDLAIMQAWHAVAFDRSKRLKKLSEYLGIKPTSQPQTTADMLAVFRSFQSRGVPMTIKQVN